MLRVFKDSTNIFKKYVFQELYVFYILLIQKTMQATVPMEYGDWLELVPIPRQN